MPSATGRRPRIAFLVVGDTYHDTRVLKTAETAVQAGADVRIFGIGGAELRFPAGLETRPNGVEIERYEVRKFSVFRDFLTRRGARSGGTLARLASWADQQINRHTARADYYSWGVQPLLAAWGPDLIHAHDANTLSAAGRAAKTLGVPFVYDSHELWTRRNRPTAALRVRLRESLNERHWARRAARVITVSPSIARWLKKHYRLRVAPELVRNIPPFNGTLPARSAGRLRELAGLQHSDKVIVYCGGISANRGIENAIAATAILPRDTHFVLLGYSHHAEFEESLRQVVDRNHLKERVHFIGAVPSEDVSATLADADVSLVLTRPTCLSYAYSLPNKLFESIHAGVPVVSTRLVDAAALIERYGVGETVSVDAAATELAARIEGVIARSDGFRAAAARAASELTWANEADRLVGVWSRALGVAPRLRVG